MKLTRIAVDSSAYTGKSDIRGLRFPVARLLRLVAAGEGHEEILAAYPYLEAQDVDEALYLSEDKAIKFNG